MVDIGTIQGGFDSLAEDINDLGVIVGASTYSTHPGQHAALWRTDNSVVDLDAWLNQVNPIQGAKWVLANAVSINNAGMVAGYGTYISEPGATDVSRGFVLDASSLIPEPSSLMLALLPILASARRLRS